MRLFRKIDRYFLYDEVTGESAPLSDYFIFYGLIGFMIFVAVVFTI